MCTDVFNFLCNSLKKDGLIGQWRVGSMDRYVIQSKYSKMLMVESSVGYIGVHGKILSIWSGVGFEKKDTKVFVSSKVLLELKCLCEKCPRNQKNHLRVLSGWMTIRGSVVWRSVSQLGVKRQEFSVSLMAWPWVSGLTSPGPRNFQESALLPCFLFPSIERPWENWV